MMPGGHLATSIALSAGAYAATHSSELAAGCLLGGFLIDVDHYVDYLLFEKQWKRPWPADFLRHYFTCQLKRVVLPLHSMELMAALILLAAFRPHPLLIGYLLGAAMHLTFDVIVNGDYALKRRVMFYSFVYRASQRFSAPALIDMLDIDPEASEHPYREFFTWRPPEYVQRAFVRRR